MNFKPLKIAGSYEITLDPIEDARGYFLEAYRESEFAAQGLVTNWIQENQSFSDRKGILRGLHFQTPPFAQTKLVRALSGTLLDVFVDLRRGSPTYGQWDAVELAADRFNLAYVPRGLGHGFCTLTDDVLVQYRVDAYYSREHDSGLRWNDPTIGVEWPVIEPLLSEKDQGLPFFASFETPFIWEG